ncbi:MAG: hypothetical protein CHACPFDD_03077 [Phycisphaerae bacterium]|nr:hypothetical protein [Phycisphaerae bacterium]
MRTAPSPDAAPPELSVVLATYQRRERLERCVTQTRATLNVRYEFVVVEGGGTDGSAAWLAQQRGVRLHVQRPRRGCCRAYDAAFRLARGEFVMWLNDDAYALPGSVDAALSFLRVRRDVGMVAFYHNHAQPWNELNGFDRDGLHFGVLHVRGHPYANFGLLRRETLARVGFLDTDYQFCAWDPDLSLKVSLGAGLPVVGLPGACVYHEELIDERKAADAGETRTRDNERLFEKWNLPPKGRFPDPRPAYAALLEGLGVRPSPTGVEP